MSWCAILANPNDPSRVMRSLESKVEGACFANVALKVHHLQPGVFQGGQFFCRCIDGPVVDDDDLHGPLVVLKGDAFDGGHHETRDDSDAVNNQVSKGRSNAFGQVLDPGVGGDDGQSHPGEPCDECQGELGFYREVSSFGFQGSFFRIRCIDGWVCRLRLYPHLHLHPSFGF